MSFTTVRVRGYFTTPDGVTPAVGTVTFRPAVALQNPPAGQIVDRDPIVATLDADGRFAVLLAASDDPTTSPVGGSYIVEERVGDSPTRSYRIVVNHDAPVVDGYPTIDLATVAPASNVPLYQYVLHADLASAIAAVIAEGIPASEVTVAAVTGLASTDAQAAIAELEAQILSQEAGDSPALAAEITARTQGDATLATQSFVNALIFGGP